MLRPTLISEFESGLRSRRLFVVAILLLLGLALRVAHLHQVVHSPQLIQHQWAESDMHNFHRWANAIAGGDWLSAHVRHPHGMYQQIITAQALEAGRTGAALPESGRALWEQWYDPKRFYQAPLYPYMVGAIYRLFGPQPLAVFILQGLLGLLSIVLVHALTRHYFGELAALIAAVLTLGYGPFLFYEATLLRVTILEFTTLLLVWTAMRAQQRGSYADFLWMGLVLGLSVLVRSSVVLYMVLFLLLWIATDRARFPGIKQLASTGIGAAVVFAPALARNVAVGLPPFQMTSANSIVFVNANTGDFLPGSGLSMSEHAGRVMLDSGGTFLSTVYHALMTHGCVADYLWQLAGKFYYFWHWFEIPNNINIYYYQHLSPLLHYTLPFYLIGPLAALGLVMALARFRRTANLYAGVAYGIATILIVQNFSRYRTPFVALLIPFAAFVLYRFVVAMSERNWRHGALMLAGVAAMAAAIDLPPSRFSERIRAADYSVGGELCVSRAVELVNRGQAEIAGELLDRCVSTMPPELGGTQGDAARYLDAAPAYAAMFRLKALLGDRGTGANHLKTARQLEELARRASVKR
jgi:hypothetical protein